MPPVREWLRSSLKPFMEETPARFLCSLSNEMDRSARHA
jgi:hypothetical protein